ncbi:MULTISPECIES: molybdenum cofactor biosynthesis protein MoaE [unclassified Xanthomonas]|uniref:molybdenum cofactor biosynthesis protein MoaE n=1 Tax=unclassified Xanthomonas TaxID=2643310 RepID=UPI002882D917|nr:MULTISPECIES: molybdenum cofactor biosynthesis protein MoaE [unclassified Xanthomonas]MEA9564096.1 molybdenum cofactor biosynthesis protein MoaE [Xanthomonas sp. WHRI 8932A]MEA9587431.1 molybdenum cofactor biosynthesis protein MoaE [Xanthomonas sp. WHRI 10064B]MEA9615152.1 molybdenum cofactor biosynthesis protein MoaE [Xanthomonas sp. WHRI 10064A]MEA9635912.1 molybdenum cofactor biosynthesis protein MoaE [Xanthomonas sp. WHRI 8812E]
MSVSDDIVSIFALSDLPLPVEQLRSGAAHPHAGAFASFEGWVRNHNEGRGVAGLRYEAYAALAQAEGQRVLDEATRQFPIVHAHCVHRVGELQIGDMAVWVGVSAAHRGAAFDACRYIIDEVKARVPIWKHEHYLEGDAGWLHPESQ